jgi:hypothetical protein
MADHSSPSLSFLGWIILAVGLGGFYLAVSAWGFGYLGFPLDDAWIHQTYARNLAESGQLAFVPGQPSAGSTAPLWSALLSLAYLLHLPFRWWSYGLGLLLLALTGWSSQRLGRRLFPESRWVGPAAGLFCLAEWHHVWAALSGMETLLFVWLSLLLVERYLAWQGGGVATARISFYLGLLGGLLTLTRPEGLGLVGLIGLHEAVTRWTRRADQRGAWFRALTRHWAGLGLGLLLLITPYVAFHLWATGLPFPNTFYAKQAEYGIILQEFSLGQRLFGRLGPVEESAQGVVRVIFIGPQLLLLPGLLYGLWLTGRERRLAVGLLWVWGVSYLLLYALRLPVTYQHGRYQIPVLAWLILLGVWGMARLLTRSTTAAKPSPVRRVISRVTILSLLLLLLGFNLLGAQAYGRDVRIIESEMVATAHWLAANTGPAGLIAAHDIGAIGYFTQRPLLDLAGLVSPEVIPIIRDEAALFELLANRRVDYLVTFPSWYRLMTGQPGLELRYTTAAPWAPAAGGDNMAVYTFPWSEVK